MFENVALHPVLPASDLERAKRWYSEKLGLEPVEVNDYGDLRFRTGGCEFLVYQSELAGINKATAAGCRLADFDGAVAALRSKGVVFEPAQPVMASGVVEAASTTGAGVMATREV